MGGVEAKEPSTGKRKRSGDDEPAATGVESLQNDIGDYLRYLASVTEASDPKTFLVRRTGNYSVVENRVLAVYGQCSNIPYFLFDLHLHPMQYWLCLYAPMIRCSLDPCGGGFVFVYWYLKEWKDIIHSTILYFDIRDKRQVFYDASGATGQLMLRYMAEHHLWEPDSDPDRKLVVVDRHVRPLQALQNRYFGPCIHRGRCVHGCN